MSDNPLPNEVWRAMASPVIDTRDSWKRAVVEGSGLPFSRIRILRRLAREPMSVKQVAAATTIDAPAATVAVNDLEHRGLVVRDVRSDQSALQDGVADRRGTGHGAEDRGDRRSGTGRSCSGLDDAELRQFQATPHQVAPK